MDKSIKIKCLGCGAFLIIVGVVVSPLFCRVCSHAPEPHTFEPEYNRIPFFAVSGISDTTTSARIQGFDTNT